MGIEPPDRFPLVYYRSNAADVHLNIDHVKKAYTKDYRAVVFSGTALSREPSRSAVLYAAEEGQRRGFGLLLDLDYRSDQWPDVGTYRRVISSLIPFIDIVLATQEELLAALDPNSRIEIKDQQISAPEIEGDLSKSIADLLEAGPATLILKSGAQGAFIYQKDGHREHIDGFEVNVVNVLGAGDAFAAGFLHGLINDWTMRKSVRLANALWGPVSDQTWLC